MKILRFLCVCCLSFLCACQSIPTDAVQTENTQIQSENNDPFERYNRVMTDFNFNINRYVYQPIAKVYRKSIPSPVRTGIDNVATNLQQPVIFVNALLQADFEGAAQTFGRFFTNTTLGLFGLFDVATKLDVEAPQKDFGQTLYVWGIKQGGPYLVLPFLGPSNMRDAVGMGINFFIDPLDWTLPKSEKHLLWWRYAFWGISVMDKSTDLLSNIEKSSVDPYTALKTMSEQNREAFLSPQKKENAYDFAFDFDDEDE